MLAAEGSCPSPNYYGPNRCCPLASQVVTLWYAAPNFLLGFLNYGIGCLLAEIFSSKPLMPDRADIEQLSMIFSLYGSELDDYWRKMKLPASFRPPKTS
ncbi:hypothetical protein E2562_038529 [Oryza meyeriana var. granulata]|uniref:[RNA-polymerase]-subunit kinase n=1 Tax=Oryza meyeriana var. granulata TaxID=110450 RepID=A0A6G1BQX7_9ORYZ|nr:hypothetical protein E2562_038529 [Oryza meyeriana var. granulata]